MLPPSTWLFALTSAQRAFLLYSKMRLAPQKTTSIPRLELLGVVIGVRAITFVHNQLHRHVESQHLWTDSRCVLFWITSPKRMSRFVENRLTTIREHPALTFHYVPTKDNPADLATRGTSALDLRDTSQWWNGPPWLSLTPSAWPQGKHPDVTPAVLEQAMQETAKAQPIHVHTMAARNVDGDSPAVVLTPMKMDPTRYSTLPHLHRISALCIRFLCTSGMDSTVGLDSASALRPLPPSWSHVEFRRLHDPDHRREYSPVNSVVDPRTATRSVC